MLGNGAEQGRAGAGLPGKAPIPGELACGEASAPPHPGPAPPTESPDSALLTLAWAAVTRLAHCSGDLVLYSLEGMQPGSSSRTALLCTEAPSCTQQCRASSATSSSSCTARDTGVRPPPPAPPHAPALPPVRGQEQSVSQSHPPPYVLTRPQTNLCSCQQAWTSGSCGLGPARPVQDAW